MIMDELYRTVVLRPYVAGKPYWTLEIGNSGNGAWHYRERVGYRLTQRQRGQEPTVIFEGDDFRPSPMHSVDGDDAVTALMFFLTLRPGDTDAEYFENYTTEQLDFACEHGESLQFYVEERFLPRSKFRLDGTTRGL